MYTDKCFFTRDPPLWRVRQNLSSFTITSLPVQKLSFQFLNEFAKNLFTQQVKIVKELAVLRKPCSCGTGLAKR